MSDLLSHFPRLKSSSSFSRSPSPPPPPPPAPLPPPLPAPDIPILLPVGPLLPPPIITRDAPVPSTSPPPPPALNQTAVYRRDKAARVAVHSPLRDVAAMQEVVEIQRGRYRARRRVPSSSPVQVARRVQSRPGSPAQEAGGFYSRASSPAQRTGRLESRPPSPVSEGDTGEEVGRGSERERQVIQRKKVPERESISVPINTVPPTAEETGTTKTRTGPARTFNEILGIDGTGFPDDSALLVSGSAFVSGSATRRGRKSLRARIQDTLFEEGADPMDGGIEVVLPCRVDSWIEVLEMTGSTRELLTVESGTIVAIESSSSTTVWGPESMSIPQTDGPSSPPSGLAVNPDPFGIQSTIPTPEAVRMAEEGRQVPFFTRLKDFFTSSAKSIGARAVNILTAGPDLDHSPGAEMHLEDPGEPEEDMGTRKAKAVVRSWGRGDLVTCYVFLVILTAYFGLGAVHSLLIIREALNYWAAKGEIKVYQLELALSMIGVTRILGIMAFAKLTNAYSRPCALFIAVIFAIGGIGLSAFAVTWESFCAGHTLFHFGRSGALIVAQVIVADISDLSWRGCFTWGLEAGLVLWMWMVPAVEKLVVGKLGWHVPIWIFFSFAFTAAIPPVVATYVFHRRAAMWGFFPASNTTHRRAWWNLRGFYDRVTVFSVNYDPLGVFLWTIGLGLLTTALSLSEKMQAGIGIWMAVLIVVGSLIIIILVVWEVWLNRGLKATRKLERDIPCSEHPTRQIGNQSHIWDSWNTERITMPGPAGYDSASVNQVAAQISARIMASQNQRNTARWRWLGRYREKCYPLFRARLLKRRTVPLGCLIGFLAAFTTRAGAWEVWERSRDLPVEYREVIWDLQGREELTKIQFTCLVIASLFVAFMIRVTKIFKWFVVSGLVLIMSGLLIFHYADISLMRQRRLIFSQSFTGLGGGMVWTGLMVGVQASCKRHSDVAISIGLLTTSITLGESAAEAMKRVMQAYLLSLLPRGSSKEEFVAALNGHWKVMLLVAMAAAGFALVMAGVGLAGHNLDEVKQHVSGIVFGTDDIQRKTVDEEHPSWATPEPFIPSPADVNSHPAPLADGPAGGNRLTSGSSETTSFAGSQAEHSSSGDEVTQNPQGRESAADWETESVVSESRTTSDSRTITSPVQVPRSYVDGIFTMEIDTETTPRAAMSAILGSYEDVSKHFASTPPIGNKEEGRIRRGDFRKRPVVRTNSVANNVLDGGGQEFSFKKRTVGVLVRGGQVNDRADDSRESSDWSDSFEDASISGGDNDLMEMTDSVSISSSSASWEFVDRNTDEEQQGMGYQFPSFGDCSGIPSVSLSSFDYESKPDSSDDATLDSEDDTETPNSETDGRLSRFSHRDDTSEASQLSVTDITLEVDLLTQRNRCFQGESLSPVAELSSRDTLVIEGSGEGLDAAATAVDGLRPLVHRDELAETTSRDFSSSVTGAEGRKKTDDRNAKGKTVGDN